MPKEDPEQTALQKELTDLIAKAKVYYNNSCYLHMLKATHCNFMNVYFQTGRTGKSSRCKVNGKMLGFSRYVQNTICNKENLERPHQ